MNDENESDEKYEDNDEEMEEDDFQEDGEFDPEYDEDIDGNFTNEDKEFEPEYEIDKDGGVRTTIHEQLGDYVYYDDVSKIQGKGSSKDRENPELENNQGSDRLETENKMEKEGDIKPSDTSSKKEKNEIPSGEKDNKKDNPEDKSLKSKKGKRGKRGKRGRRGKPGKSIKIPSIAPKFIKNIEGELNKGRKSKKGMFKKTETELKEEILKEVYKKVSVDVNQQEQSDRAINLSINK